MKKETFITIKTKHGQSSKPTKIFLLFFLICLICSFLLTSCTTVKKFNSSKEECDYALHYVLEKANESTMSSFFFRITETEIFLPDNLNFINENANQIPGMKKLLDNWTISMRTYTLDWFEGFKTLTGSLTEQIIFENPESLVLESDFSAAQTMENAYKERILSYVKTVLANADLSKWENVAAQYNAWVKVRKTLFDEDVQSLEGVDIVNDMASYICELYFEDLKAAETLERTTPNPNADTTVAKVFGLE